MILIYLQDLIKVGLEHINEAKRAGTALAVVNMAVEQGDANNTVTTILHDDLNLFEKVENGENYKKRYQEALRRLLKAKQRVNSPWVLHT